MEAGNEINHKQTAFERAVLEWESAAGFEAQAFGQLQIAREERRGPTGELLLERAAPLGVFGTQRILL